MMGVRAEGWREVFHTMKAALSVRHKSNPTIAAFQRFRFEAISCTCEPSSSGDSVGAWSCSASKDAAGAGTRACAANSGGDSLLARTLRSSAAMSRPL